MEGKGRPVYLRPGPNHTRNANRLCLWGRGIPSEHQFPAAHTTATASEPVGHKIALLYVSLRIYSPSLLTSVTSICYTTDRDSTYHYIMQRKCLHCQTVLPAECRDSKLFCRTACRVAHHRTAAVTLDSPVETIWNTLNEKATAAEQRAATLRSKADKFKPNA